jgi:hypothetical protein
MNEKRFVYFALIVFISVLVADSLSRHYGFTWAFWFLGGAMIGLGGQLTLVAGEKRSPTKVLLATLLTALLASAAAMLAALFGYK